MDGSGGEQWIDELIDRRSKDGENTIENLWAASDRKDREKRRQELREAWACYHEHLSRLHAALSAEHRTKSEALCDAQRE